MDSWLFPFYAPSRDLALLDALSDDALFPHRLREAAQRRPQEWHQSVNVRGFSPKEVSVKTEGGKVRIHARHADGEDVTEISRCVELPDCVQADKLLTRFTRDGTLVLCAPFKESQVAAGGAGNSVWDEVRQLLRGPELADAEAHIVDGPDGQKKFKAEVSVREYKPEEVRVRQQDDCVMVVAEHKAEHGGQRVHRRLERAFRLPPGTQQDHLVSRLSHDGRLCIEAPYQKPVGGGNAQKKLKDVPMEVEKPQEQQKELQEQKREQQKEQKKH